MIYFTRNMRREGAADESSSSSPARANDAVAHIKVGAYYEIDLSNLYQRSPEQLKPIMIVMANNVSLGFPSMYSLRSYFGCCGVSGISPMKPERSNAILPVLDESHVMESELAGEVLHRRSFAEVWSLIGSNSTAAWNAKSTGSKKWVLFPPDVAPPGVHPSPGGTEVAFPVSIIEWFMNFGAVFFGGLVDKKLSSPIQAGDEAILRLLIKTNIDVNETNAERNMYLKASFLAHMQRARMLSTFHSIFDDDVEEMEVERAESANCKNNSIRVLFSISKGILLTPKKISGVISEKNLKMILNSKPDTNVEIIEALDGRYARWRKHQEIPDSLEGVNWFEQYGKVRDQGSHGTCWAFASTELVSAYRKIRGYDPKYIEYSPQELVDFACRGKENKRKTGHYCYGLSTIRGLEYIKKNGVQREEDRKYVGCKSEVSPRKSSLPTVRIKDVKELSNYEEVLEKLRTGPLGASLACFNPDLKNVGSEIYRGPTHAKSEWVGSHAIQIVGADKNDGESYFWVRASNGTKLGINGYLKVSMDVRLVHIPPKGGEIRKPKYFGEPMPLITRFCYPEVD